MPQSQLVMVLVVEHIEQIAIEWMDIVHFGEILQNID